MLQVFSNRNPWPADLFTGKVVFVMGGLGPICKSQTRAMVLLGANAAVAGNEYTSTVAATKEILSARAGSKVIPCAYIDTRSVKSIAIGVDYVVREFGKIDFVIASPTGNFLADFNHISSSGFATIASLDILGSLNTLRACIPELHRSNGSILFVNAALHCYPVPFSIPSEFVSHSIGAVLESLPSNLPSLGIKYHYLAPVFLPSLESKSLAYPSSWTSPPLTSTDFIEATISLFSPAASNIFGAVHFVTNLSPSYITGPLQFPVVIKEHLYRPSLKL